ncbi:MAG: serine/threonine-protein kinase, partial [Kofleriaceae bacterium]
DRYALEGELARGGMGRIWIAKDVRLDRKVAIKELLDPIAGSSGQRARFERELALTSRLEHPSIVSIQDGGTWPDGRPYYVMRLVRGESLDRVIDRAHTLADRMALLPYGLATVDALAYAHAQGIVHHDLKPENVLVGDFGETVVIDWGLAKDLRAATPELVEGPYRDLVRDGETLGGEVLGTPAYMAPEQALGDAVDERADVYALGALLYHVLSGARPYRGTSADEVLANVISGPPLALVERAPGVPVDLVTIVDKAMAREPADRYANAGALAEDLKRFQSGQLVGAHRYTSGQLVRRWLRRQRTAVTVAVLALLALATFGAISLVRIVRSERAAREAQAVAVHQKELADQRKDGAEALVTYMLGDLRGTLEPLGKLALLEQPAKRVLAYFADGRELAPDERASRAIALEHLGDALRTKGDVAGAEVQLRASLAELAQLAVEGHHDLLLEATLHLDLADVLALRGAPGAVAEYRAGVAAFAALAKVEPANKAAAHGHATALGKLADAQEQRHDPKAAEAIWTEAIAAARASVAAGDDDDAELALTTAEHGLAGALAAHGNLAGALTAYRATLARLAGRANAPDDFAVVRAQAITEHRIGIVLEQQHDEAGALQAWRRSEARSNELVAHDPDNAGWQYERALTVGRIASAQQATGDAGAAASYGQALAQLRAVAAKDPSNLGVQRDILVVETQLSELDADHKEWKDAELLARDAVTLAERRIKSDPTNRQAAHDASDAYAAQGAALQALGRIADARAVFVTALAVAQELVKSDPADAAAQYNVQEALVNLADATCASRQDARGLFAQARAVTDPHLAAAPGDANWQQLDQDLRTRARACRR